MPAAGVLYENLVRNYDPLLATERDDHLGVPVGADSIACWAAHADTDVAVDVLPAGSAGVTGLRVVTRELDVRRGVGKVRALVVINVDLVRIHRPPVSGRGRDVEVAGSGGTRDALERGG